MCTVTWRQHRGGYDLFCNRDELKTRRSALPPHVDIHNGVRCLAPQDTEAGGSWIGVNEFGVTLCLLNHYPAANSPASPAGFVSRGYVVKELIDSPTVAIVRRRLSRFRLQYFKPFIFLALAPGPRIWACLWEGAGPGFKKFDVQTSVITSSSFATAAVVAQRQAYFQQALQNTCRGNEDFYLRFHRSHYPACGPFSVCMHRDDAETVSFSHVKVRGDRAIFAYWPAAPCRVTQPLLTALPLTVDRSFV